MSTPPQARLEVAAPGSARARAVAEFCAGLRPASPPNADDTSHPAFAAVQQAGSEPWLDSGDVEANRTVWTREFAAFTTNNSLLNAEVQKGTYDELVPRAAAAVRRAEPAPDADELVFEIGLIVNAAHGLVLAHEFGGMVCVELHTNLAHDAEGSYRCGRRLHAIAPDRFVIKVPNTPEGLIAARRLEDDGVPVNFTLGFSARQNFLAARLARPHFVNVFLGRIGTLLEGRDGVPPGPWGEAAAIRSQQVVRELMREQSIPEHTRQIAASMRKGSQVEALLGIDVLTMPVSVAREFRDAYDGGDVRDRTREDPWAQLGEPPIPGGKVFARVEEVLTAAAAHLIDTPIDVLEGNRIRAVLRDHTLDDLYPECGEEERERIAADGKIPDFDAWVERVEAGTASWDGLLTEAGLKSFASDQRQLDRRIRDAL